MDSSRSSNNGTPKLVDYKCPICLYILVEPVTMPCKHNLCIQCYRQTVEESNLCCPLCRKRISVWARRASKSNTLIDKKLWAFIQDNFHKKVQERLNGLEESDSSDEDEFIHVPLISAPGEIKKEFEQQMLQLDGESSKNNDLMKKQIELSEQLIEQLQREEEELVAEKDRQRLQDEQLARELSKTLNDANVKSPENCEKNRKKTVFSPSNPCMQRFLKVSVPRYEFKDSNDGEKISENSDKHENSQKESTSFHNFDEVFNDSDCLNYDNSEQISTKSFYSDCSSRCDTSYSNTSSHDTEKLINEMAVSSSSSYNGEKCAPRLTLTRNDSFESKDSISAELCYFKPIRPSPKTPPKTQKSGEYVPAPLIECKPKKSHNKSSSSDKLASIKPNFSLINDRLINFEEEKKLQAELNSKSVSTENKDDNNIFNSFVKRRACTNVSATISRNVEDISKLTIENEELDSHKSFENKFWTFEDKENNLHDDNFDNRSPCPKLKRSMSNGSSNESPYSTSVKKTKFLKYIEFSPDSTGKKFTLVRRSHREKSNKNKKLTQMKLSFVAATSSKDSDSDCEDDKNKIGNMLERSDFDNDFEFQMYAEEYDRKLAIQLQEDFDFENRYNLNAATRRKGSNDEYHLRKNPPKSRTSTTKLW